jgi:sugar phosphate isomerase/epimerase
VGLNKNVEYRMNLEKIMTKAAVGLQLFSVRRECAKDLPATLKAVRAIGYEAVEPWGFDGSKLEWKGRSPKDLRKLLDDNGLACCGMHLGVTAIEGDNLARTAEMNQALGNRFLIVASDKTRTGSEAGVAELAGLLAAVADKLAPMGLFVGYHAHSFDFGRFGDRTAWDLLFSSLPPAVIMQLDIGNCAAGGGDPVAILRKFPGRARSLHLKEYGGPDGSVIGEGHADWKEIFRLCAGQTEWYVVEEGDPDGRGFEICRRSLESLRRMGV